MTIIKDYRHIIMSFKSIIKWHYKSISFCLKAWKRLIILNSYSNFRPMLSRLFIWRNNTNRFMTNKSANLIEGFVSLYYIIDKFELIHEWL